MRHIVTTFRLIGVTMFVCCIGYTTLIWAIANAVTPWTARGSLFTNDTGEIIGSALLAQPFTEPRYFWPRPSAVDYNASATGGSNLSPASPALVARLQPLIEAHAATPDRPLPADLATASGGGLDPHITLEAAVYQVPRVANARHLDEAVLERWLKDHAETPGGILGSGPLVHVLRTNIALDRGEVR